MSIIAARGALCSQNQAFKAMKTSLALFTALSLTTGLEVFAQPWRSAPPPPPVVMYGHPPLLCPNSHRNFYRYDNRLSTFNRRYRLGFDDGYEEGFRDGRRYNDRDRFWNRDRRRVRDDYNEGYDDGYLQGFEDAYNRRNHRGGPDWNARNRRDGRYPDDWRRDDDRRRWRDNDDRRRWRDSDDRDDNTRRRWDDSNR